MAFRGRPGNLRRYAENLTKLDSEAVGQRIAELGAKALTARMQSDFDAGETAYGDSRPDGFHGPVTVVKSGKLRSYLSFAATGRRIRCVLAVPYARFMVGRFKVLPSGSASLPYAWSQELDAIAKRVRAETVAGGKP